MVAVKSLSVDDNKRIRRMASGLLVGYGLQFLAGMTLNLFVSVPSTHPGVNSTDYFSGAIQALGWSLAGRGGWAMTIHVYLAIGLVLGAISIAVRGWRYRSKLWTSVGTVVALFTIGALFNGLSFVNYNHDFSSMIMAVTWLIAVGAIVFGLKCENPA